MHRDGTHVVRSAKGSTLVDEDGRELLDGLAGLWCVNVGYGREEIANAVAEQMRAVAFYPSFFNTTTEPTIRLAAKLAELAPPRLQHTIFTNSGSEANETALKLIRAYWKLRGRREKTKVLARTFAYHGVGIATTSLTGLPTCTEPFDLPLPGFLHVPGPYSYGSGKSPEEYGAWCLAETERPIAREGARHDRARCSSSRCRAPAAWSCRPPATCAALRELCRRHEILFVADEVITGFGRLGAWFASVLWELDPDLHDHGEGHHQRLPAARRHHGERRDRRGASRPAATSRTASPTPATRPPAPPRSRTSTSSSARASSSACATTSARASRRRCASSPATPPSPRCAASA